MSTSRDLSRFLFWVRYDGSLFSEMAKGNTPRSIINLFNICASRAFKANKSDIIYSLPTSRYICIFSSKIHKIFEFRTDAGVHAIRTPIRLSTPTKFSSFTNSKSIRNEVIKDFNATSKLALNGTLALELIDYHQVSLGFCALDHISYR